MKLSPTKSGISRSNNLLREISSMPNLMNVWKAKKIKRSVRQIRAEKIFRASLVLISLSILVIVIAFLFTLIVQSLPSIKALGFGFLIGKTWDPVHNIYGTYPFLLGTLLTSFLALIISIPFSFATAIFLGEYYPRGWFSEFLKNAIELIAAVPSVIYGFWGLFVLVPIVRSLELKIGVTPYGIGIFSASLILTIMIIPYAASLGREMVRMVPSSLKEAAYSLGATRYEVIRDVILPYSRSGLFAGVLLSLGRALGETMAVTMVIGNTSVIPKSIFAPGNTMASVIANEFTEAASSLYLSALIEIGLVLFLVTVIINMVGKRIIKRFTTE
ncbi:MAG TPA: phosphate ABC transporter permease subunit PstC [Hanamia sp.]